jgi:hypothetical protein
MKLLVYRWGIEFHARTWMVGVLPVDWLLLSFRSPDGIVYCIGPFRAMLMKELTP